MIEEFKEFINQGNLVDMAVAFVMGTAFAAVMDSLVNDILMQIIAAIFGQPDFSGITIHWGKQLASGAYEHQIMIGAFINALITFLIIGFAMFLVVKAYNSLKKDEAEDAPDEVQLLTEIRDALKTKG